MYRDYMIGLMKGIRGDEERKLDHPDDVGYTKHLYFLRDNGDVVNKMTRNDFNRAIGKDEEY